MKLGNQQEHVYQSIIYLNCNNCLLFSKPYHPAQLELDSNIKKEMIKKGAALEQIINKFNQILDSKIDADVIRIENVMKSLRDSLNEIDKNTNYIREIFSYNSIYKTMSDLNCDINKAIEVCRQQKRKEDEEQRLINEQKLREEERIRNIETKFSKKGDKILNRYTDTVIADITVKLKAFPQLCIYGGSSFADWFLTCEKKMLSFPNILVYTDCAYTFEDKSYTNINNDGEPIVHTYTPNALPINYGIKLKFLQRNKPKLIISKNK